MQIRLLAVSTVLVLGGSALAYAGTGSVSPSTQPLVAADGHQLAPRDAAFAGPDRLAQRNAGTARAEAVAYWGEDQTNSAPAGENSVVGRLGVGMATFWTGGYVAARDQR